MLPKVIRFEAPWEPQLKVATSIILGFLLCVAVAAPVLGLVLAGPTPELIPFAVPVIVISVILGMTWALAPRGYALDEDAFTILRAVSPIQIPYRRIRAIAPLTEGLRGAVRFGGNGGLFGYYGRFWSRQLGAFRLYATRRTDLVRVDTEDEVFVVAPADAQRFIAAVQQRSPNARGAAHGSEPAPMRLSVGRALRVVAFVAAAVGLLMSGIFGAINGFAPRSIAVVGDVVRVQRRWAAPVDIPFTHIHKVERLDPQYGKRWWRTGGTAMGNVRYGQFGSRELGAFRLYAYRGDPYVLLETDEGRVVLTPDDPDSFVRDASAALARP